MTAIVQLRRQRLQPRVDAAVESGHRDERPLLGRGVDALTGAISGGDSGDGANFTAGVDPYAGCDPNAGNFTACLQDPPGGDGGNSSLWGNLLRGVVGGLANVASNLIAGDDGADAPPPGPP